MAYNAAYPGCPIPGEPAERHRLRGYHHAMLGVMDDLTGTGASMTVEFLSGGPPLPGEAWRAIVCRWPARLSEVRFTSTPSPTRSANSPFNSTFTLR